MCLNALALFTSLVSVASCFLLSFDQFLFSLRFSWLLLSFFFCVLTL